MYKLRLSTLGVLHNTLLNPSRNLYVRMQNRHPEFKAFNANLGRTWRRHNLSRYADVSDRMRIAAVMRIDGGAR